MNPCESFYSARKISTIFQLCFICSFPLFSFFFNWKVCREIQAIMDFYPKYFSTHSPPTNSFFPYLSILLWQLTKLIIILYDHEIPGLYSKFPLLSPESFFTVGLFESAPNEGHTLLVAVPSLSLSLTLCPLPHLVIMSLITREIRSLALGNTSDYQFGVS